MKIKEFYHLTNLHCLNPELIDEREISGVFIGDLLSWVMGNAEAEQIWITVQSHLNVIAVASLKEMAAIILAQGAKLDEEVLNKANEEKLIIFTSDLPAYSIAKICSELGL